VLVAGVLRRLARKGVPCCHTQTELLDTGVPYWIVSLSPLLQPWITARMIPDIAWRHQKKQRAVIRRLGTSQKKQKMNVSIWNLPRSVGLGISSWNFTATPQKSPLATN
jgi:hypothetical protein